VFESVRGGQGSTDMGRASNYPKPNAILGEGRLRPIGCGSGETVKKFGEGGPVHKWNEVRDEFKRRRVRKVSRRGI